jgi:hypothetical protein
LIHAIRPPDRWKACADAALWDGAKAAFDDFLAVPDPLGDSLQDENDQRAAAGTLYVAANSARYLAPAMDFAADLIPVAGQVYLALQTGHALVEGGEAMMESLDQCYREAY